MSTRIVPRAAQVRCNECGAPGAASLCHHCGVALCAMHTHHPGELARMLLDQENLAHVVVEKTDHGDHYDPIKKAVRLEF